MNKNNLKQILKRSGKEISPQTDLYWFTLIPRATSSSQKPLGIHYVIKIQITNNHTKEVTLNTSSTHTSLGNHTTKFRTTSNSAHTKEVILNTSRTHTSLGKHTIKFRTTSDFAHTKEVILNTSRTHTSLGKTPHNSKQPLILLTPPIFRNTIEGGNRIGHTWYKSNQSTQQVLLHS